jgi:glycosyltransferase involved in cell wall biosynthesis
VHFTAASKGGREEVDGVKIIRLRRRREKGYKHQADFGRLVLPYLAGRRFDAVHSFGCRDALASVRAARLHTRRRTVYTDLGIPMRRTWEGIPKEARAVEKVVSGIDVYSCMSRWAVDSLRREYARGDGVVVPGGIDFELFLPAPVREPNPVILFSGALDAPHKEVPLLLEALALVARQEPEVELWLSGEGDPEPLVAAAPPEARERIRPLGVGDPHRQHERYGRAWVTCLPSRFDSFGMALLESLACGTPLVTTTEGAPHELVTEHATGELCAPGDAASLAAACLRGFELARRPETVNACRSSAEPFDWDRGLAPLVERLYAGEYAGDAPLVERIYAGEDPRTAPRVGRLHADDGLGA